MISTKNKILHIVHHFPPYNIGGTELYVYNLCKAQIKDGYDVYVLSTRPNIQSPSLEERDIDGIKTFFISGGASIWPFIRNRHLKKFFTQIFSKTIPDIIHIHHLSTLHIGHHTFIIDSLKNYKNHYSSLKLLLAVHDWWYFCGRAHFMRSNLKLCHKSSLFDCLTCEGLRPLRIPYLNPFYLLYYSFCWFKKRQKTKLLFHLADKIIFGSETIKRDYVKTFKVLNKNPKIEVLPYAINYRPIFNSPSKKLFQRPLKIGYIGNLGFHKGVHILIRALNLIPSNKYQCEIYGSTFEKKHLQHCLELAYGNPSIKFMGSFKEEERESIIKSFSLMVIPSLAHESFCFSLWEALACGIPLLASDFGIFREFIDQKKCGILFERNNPKALADKIKKIIDGNITFEVDSSIFTKILDWPSYHLKLEPMMLHNSNEKKNE